MWREGSEGGWGWRFYLIKLYLTRPSLPPANKGRLLGREGSEADEDVSYIIDGQAGNGVFPSIKAYGGAPGYGEGELDVARLSLLQLEVPVAVAGDGVGQPDPQGKGGEGARVRGQGGYKMTGVWHGDWGIHGGHCE